MAPLASIPIPLQVLSVTPVASSGVGPANKFGYTEFTVTFNPTPAARTAATYNYTGTYSYLIAPDDGNGNAIESPIRASVIARSSSRSSVRCSRRTCLFPIPSSGTGGTGTSDDITTSTITLAGHANAAHHRPDGRHHAQPSAHQRPDDPTVAPDGRSTVIFQGTSNGPLNFVNRQFTVNVLNGGPVNGIYQLIITDNASNNTGTLTAWSIKINSELPTFGLQTGDPMDQNADGTADQNAVTTAFTGLTPGDVYAVPTPQPTTAVTFLGAASILSPPFNQNTLPLIVPGPQVLEHLGAERHRQRQPGHQRHD